jgi:hypothetical protein
MIGEHDFAYAGNFAEKNNGQDPGHIVELSF